MNGCEVTGKLNSPGADGVEGFYFIQISEKRIKELLAKF
jgi:hypothetical protein